ncbi:IclR family transcriptional regulator [Halapricum hydrolyticum]|uniref:IclR family transcriptional regulator n=1 Tax=Halapricum hydrolyticum TaxID=2979991 RepID=A0AAE3IBE1_9EURY|nr:IclR family transcriptional regulator [Halapricum hydrolyticum]MCU4718535.1 IclR family transcriptional regulator [Halapricum hydrolyticum]MCU4727446.1 IclR family transcriptional regulator [Halapricum hydrolyticum]
MDTSSIPEASTFDRQTAKTTVTTFRIVEALKRQSRARVSELADELDLAKGTVHKHLSTLRKVNYVVQEGKQYRLSLRFMGLGATVRSNLDIYQVAYRSVEKLAEATGEVASIMIPENGYGVYVLRVSAEGRPDIDIREGESVPLTATAGGKAILANMSAEEREQVISRHGLPELTENTITDPEELRDELRRVRNRRRAIDRGEYHPGQRCVAASITDLEGNPLGAVIVSGPSDRMNEKLADADFASLVGSTADSVQSRLYR